MGESEGVDIVELPTELVTRLEERVRHTEFEDVAEYVTYVLEEVLYHVEQGNDFSGVEEIDKDQVRDRLRSLGYLNE